MAHESGRGGSTETAIAFMDVLGFSDFIRATPHEVAVGRYRLLTEALAAQAASLGTQVVPDDTGGTKLRFPTVHIVSDSFVIHRDVDTAADILHVLLAVRSMIWLGMIFGMPLRGAVVLGPVSIIQTKDADGERTALSIVGRGLLDAYELEARQEWSGAVASDALVDRLATLLERPPPTQTVVYGRHQLLLRAEVPWKSRVSGVEMQEAWTVTWPQAYFRMDADQERAVFGSISSTRDTVREAFGAFGRDPDKASRKLGYTLAYLERCEDGAPFPWNRGS